MKPITITYFSCLLIALTIFNLSCKKNINLQNEGLAFQGPPSTVPLFVNQIESYVDQWSRLSIGYSALLNNTGYCDENEFIIHLNNLVADNNDEPVRNHIIYNYLKSKSFIFNIPAPSHNDLYDAIKNCISNYQPPTAINTWDNSFFGSFLHNWGSPTLDHYYITLGIPMRQYQANNGNWTKPAIVCPDPDVFGFPIKAYTINGSTIIELNLIDEDEYEELVEGGDFMVFTLQYNYDFIDEKSISGNCEGGYVSGDNQCDGNCGENETNSPNDCGDHSKNKVVYLKEFKINTDIAKTQENPKFLRKHWEGLSSGRYDPGFSVWTLGTNGNFESINKVPIKKVKLTDVNRKRIKKNGNVKQNGTSIFISGIDRTTDEESVVSSNYNPLLHNIYIFFYENDPLKNQKSASMVPLTYSTTTFDSLKWRGNHGNMTAGKFGSGVWGWRQWWNGSPPAPAASSYYELIEPNTQQWVDEFINGEPAKVYYHQGNEDNKVDFVLYYFINKRAK